MIGGLIRNEVYKTTKKIPILGDIPILGLLFTHKGGDTDKNKERELLVFITPRIVKDTGVAFAQLKKTTLPMREQNAGSALDRQTVISTTLNSFDKAK
jgi:type II secretory pathway component GspD/PulD (secretin)